MYLPHLTQSFPQAGVQLKCGVCRAYMGFPPASHYYNFLPLFLTELFTLSISSPSLTLRRVFDSLHQHRSHYYSSLTVHSSWFTFRFHRGCLPTACFFSDYIGPPSLICIMRFFFSLSSVKLRWHCSSALLYLPTLNDFNGFTWQCSSDSME